MKLEEMKQVLEIQGYDGNWDCNEYMFGMYNGMELMMAIAENRSPVYKDAPEKYLDEKHQLIQFEGLITNGFPRYDQSFTGRIEKGWNVVTTIPANTVHPYAHKTDMITIFSKYTPYPKNNKQDAVMMAENKEENE